MESRTSGSEMTFEYELPTPPTARITTVAALNRFARGPSLSGINDETLVEIQPLGGVITDDEVLVRVSATVASTSDCERAMLLIPARWYEDLPRMRELLTVPDDLRNLNLTQPARPSAVKPRRRGRRPKIEIKPDEEIGKELAKRWRRPSTNHISLGDSTREWLSMCEEEIPDSFAVEYLQTRKLLANMYVRKADRTVVAEFCERLASQLGKKRQNKE